MPSKEQCPEIRAEFESCVASMATSIGENLTVSTTIQNSLCKS